MPCELKSILSSYIFDKHYFTLELFNARLASFDYGYSDRKNNIFSVRQVTVSKKLWGRVRDIAWI